MSLNIFHPVVATWFAKRFAEPTEPQAKAWPSIKAGKNTLIAAPTGSGKTLSAFLASIDDLIRQGIAGTLKDETQVLYVSPLKALSNDIERNLNEPLAGIKNELREQGYPEIEIRTWVRTGDTPSAERAKMIRRPPHIVITTPESFYLLLTSESGRNMLRTVKTLIIDEIHAIVRDKRGTHLSLSMERLEAIADRPPLRIGLSATQKPIEKVAEFLMGASGTRALPGIINTGHKRDIDLSIELPPSPLEAVMSNEVWEEVYDRLALLINEHATTLIFVNTRRMAERIARHMADRIGNEHITSHHGSLSKERRLDAEQRLKNGELKALVATASLELGIDIGAINLVCQIGSTRSIATMLQRVGRSGHFVGGFPKGRLFPTSRDELVECAALIDSSKRGELDALIIPENAVDILAQQIVAEVANREYSEDELYELICRSYSYRNLSRKVFDDVIRMLADGFTTRRGRASAYIHHDSINHKLRPRKSARLTAITNGGAIPDNADFDVILEPESILIGTINEDFAVESMAGDIFQLGNASWMITRVENGRVRVVDAEGQPPTIPFWLGEAPGRTDELSFAVSRFRVEVTDREPGSAGILPASAVDWLVNDLGLSQYAAEQITEYLHVAKLALGVMPSHDTIVLERFFDESGGTQLIVHSPFGSRINRAWGLSLRKRFCKKFNFELQAAATEDAIILSLSHSHSFPLTDIFDYLRSKTVKDILIQAMLDSPMFTARWRWNSNRSLAIVRRRGGKKIPPQIQRMNAEDLLAAVFPDQVACGENIVGDREVPDHPLVNQTIRDCLEEAMDIHGLEALLTKIEKRELNLIARDLREPSPLAAEILNARPYAFLDDAPLEERRTRAVMSRRWIDPETAADLGTLDQAAIDQVREEAWPRFDNEDELHDALMQLGFMTSEEIFNTETQRNGDTEIVSSLISSGRLCLFASSSQKSFYIAAEREKEFKSIYEGSDEALIGILRGRLDGVGPVTVSYMAAFMELPMYRLESALMALESEGFVMRGQFTPRTQETEWCTRRLLARIHRYTVSKLRKVIEPVSAADFMRFLFYKHGVLQVSSEVERAETGLKALTTCMNQLEGFEAAAAAWESDLIPLRLGNYDPQWLDSLCLSGKLVWGRFNTPKLKAVGGGGSTPIRSTPIIFINRSNLVEWNAAFQKSHGAPSNDNCFSDEAKQVFDHLVNHGASFFDDISAHTRLLPAQIENALAELTATGVITSDSFGGLRILLTPNNKRARHIQHVGGWAGRWSRIPNPPVTSLTEENAKEQIARILLRRYGVVFRKLLDRESVPISWGELLRIYRRLEARGEIRGGRFVAGFSGEQFAFSEAIPSLRNIRKMEPDDRLISISASDPLNLVGIILPGDRISSIRKNRILFRNGVPVATLESGVTNILVTPSNKAEEWKFRTALIQQFPVSSFQFPVSAAVSSFQFPVSRRKID